MSDQEKKEFRIDVNTFNWDQCFLHTIFGLRRYYMKEDILPPDAHFRQLLQKNSADWFHDIRTAKSATLMVTYKTTTIYFQDILQPKNFQAYVKNLYNNQKKTSNGSGYPV